MRHQPHPSPRALLDASHEALLLEVHDGVTSAKLKAAARGVFQSMAHHADALSPSCIKARPVRTRPCGSALTIHAFRASMIDPCWRQHLQERLLSARVGDGYNAEKQTRNILCYCTSTHKANL